MAIFNHELAPVTHTGGFRKPARPASDAAEGGRPSKALCKAYEWWE